jgi:hypothetical protein
MSSDTASRQHLSDARHHAQAPAAGDHGGPPSDEGNTVIRRSWAVLTIALTAQILVVLDISVTSMAGIPASHAGLASGFLMTGHEVGAALGVAVLPAVATSAGSLASATGVAAGFSSGFTTAAAVAVLVAVFAYLRMPVTKAAAGSGMHLHH